MASSSRLQKDLESLREEIAGLRQEQARLKTRVSASKSDAAERFGSIRDELAGTIETIRRKLAEGADEAVGEVGDQLNELRDLANEYSGRAEKTVATHPYAALAGALALGYLIGRLGR